MSAASTSAAAPAPSAAVARIRFLSYVKAAEKRWTAYTESSRALRPLLQTDDARKLVAVLTRHGRSRAEEALPVPVELILEILSYVLPPGYAYRRTHGWVSPQGTRLPKYCSRARALTLHRAMLAHSSIYFLVMENDWVKNPEVAPFVMAERPPKAPLTPTRALVEDLRRGAKQATNRLSRLDAEGAEDGSSDSSFVSCVSDGAAADDPKRR